MFSIQIINFFFCNRSGIKLDIKFSGKEDTFVYNDFYAAFTAYNGVLIVDTVNATSFDVRETDSKFCGVGPIYLQGDRLAKFTSKNCLSVWNFATGNRSDVQQLPLPDHYKLLFAEMVDDDLHKNTDKLKLFYLLQKADSEVITCVKKNSRKNSNFEVESQFVRDNQIIWQSSHYEEWQPCRNHHEPTVVQNLSIRINVPYICSNWKFDDPLWRSVQLEAISLNGGESISLSTIEIADDWDVNRFDIKNVFFTSTSMVVVYVHDTYYPPGKAIIKIFDFLS